MNKTPNGWTILDQEAGILSYEYEFATGATANAFAVRIKDGKILVISPPAKVKSGVFDDLADFGEITALVPNNGFHHLGLVEWKNRFPSASIFADALAEKRIRKKNRGVLEFRPLAELTPLLGESVGVTAVPDTKCGESWAWAKGRDGYFWYCSDVLANIPRLPANFFVRTLFKLTGTKTGFGVFHTAMKFIVKNKARVLAQLAEEMSTRPPISIVPAHGGILSEAGIAQRAQEVIASALN